MMEKKYSALLFLHIAASTSAQTICNLLHRNVNERLNETSYLTELRTNDGVLDVGKYSDWRRRLNQDVHEPLLLENNTGASSFR